MASRNRNIPGFLPPLSFPGTHVSVDHRVATELAAQGAYINDVTVYDVQQAQLEAATPRHTSIRSLIRSLFISRKPATTSAGTPKNWLSVDSSLEPNDGSVSVDQGNRINVPMPRA